MRFLLWPQNAAGEKLQQQGRVEVLAEQVQPSADEREAEAKSKVGSDDLRRAECGEAEQRDGAERACS